MKTRLWGKALVGLATVVAAVGLLGLPSSAITAEITAGTLDIYASDSTLYSSQDLGSTTTIDCSGSDGEITAPRSTDGFFEAHFSSHTSTIIGGQHFTVLLTIDLTGTMSHDGTFTATGTASATLWVNDSTDCDHIFSPCTIEVANLHLVGESDVTSHDPQVSDTILASGGTSSDHGAFNFHVSVTAPPGHNCGALIALDDGSVTVTDLELHITSLSTG